MEYKRALSELNALPQERGLTPTVRDLGCWCVDNWPTIRRALMIADAVENYPVASGSTWNDAVAHTIEHLRKIGEGE